MPRGVLLGPHVKPLCRPQQTLGWSNPSAFSRGVATCFSFRGFVCPIANLSEFRFPCQESKREFLSISDIVCQVSYACILCLQRIKEEILSPTEQENRFADVAVLQTPECRVMIALPARRKNYFPNCPESLPTEIKRTLMQPLGDSFQLPVTTAQLPSHSSDCALGIISRLSLSSCICRRQAFFAR